MIPQWTSIRTYLVQQEYEESVESPLRLVMKSDPEHQALLRQIEVVEKRFDDQEGEGGKEGDAVDDTGLLLSKLYDKLHTHFDESEMERRATTILSQDRVLGFSKEMMHRPFKELSGGWRMKTLLACAVFTQPDLLLMDEPTNHLDLESIQWLVKYLKSLKCTVVVVSHDHDFMDQLSECVIHLTQKQLRYYPGNYTAFKKNRQDKLNEQYNTEQKRQQVLTSTSSTSSSSSSSLSSKRLQELNAPKIAKMSKKNLVNTAWVWGGEALLVGAEGEDDKHLALRFPPPDASVSDPLIQIKDIGFAYKKSDFKENGKDEKKETRQQDSPSPPLLLWEHVDMSIDLGSRVAILGRNGLGKSTLLRCIAGLETPRWGTITRHHNLRMAVFTQHLVQVKKNMTCPTF